MAFLNPSSIVDKFNIIPGMKVADFGSGSGHFTIEMAKRAGNSGLVYAFDVRKEPLSAVKSMAALKGVFNLETNCVDLELEKSTKLADDSLDLILISNMLFQVDDRSAIAKEAFRVLKSEGRLVFIESKSKSSFSEGVSVVGPPEKTRISKMEAQSIFSKEGFYLQSEFEAGDNHYGMVFAKP